ncbi:hypothetical protein [Sorangium sp. So ce887]|uniref:hypothetical protein n=1 Tax=Sorangium sp. So ce887 TaxID=3133324 RepID=UPI003F62B343
MDEDDTRTLESLEGRARRDHAKSAVHLSCQISDEDSHRFVDQVSSGILQRLQPVDDDDRAASAHAPDQPAHALQRVVRGRLSERGEQLRKDLAGFVRGCPRAKPR